MDSNNDEIICISSDDDEDTRQVLFKNNTVTKKESVINLLEDNCNSLSNSPLSSTKVEISLNDNKKVKGCVPKRKASEIIDYDDSCVERNSKLACKQGDSVKAHNLKEETKKKGMEDKILLRPKLIVKEKRTISSVEQDIFPMFISLCLQKDRSDDMKKIVNKLKRRYEQLDPSYANSEAFIDFLNEKRNEIMESNCKLYTYINEVMNEMKNNCKGKWTLSSNSKSYFSGGNKLNKDSNSNISTAMCSNMSHTSNSIINDNEIALTNKNDEEEQEKEFAVQKKIGKILKAMKKCEKIIKKLEESEIDFDDENNSSYIKLEKYKYRMVELYNKYCEYSDENIDAGRQYLRPKHFSTTGIVSVDHAITSFINSKILKRNKLKKVGDFTKALIFPDYNDILKCVTKCDELHSLGLNDRTRQDIVYSIYVHMLIVIAKKAFIGLGEYLQRCRRNDYWDTFSLFLEGKEDDPALKDTELAEKLIKNKKMGETKLLRKANSDIEMGEICERNINDRLRGYEYDNLTSEKVSNVNTSNCKNNFKSEPMMESHTISAPDRVKRLNTTSNISLSITANNKIIIDKTKEDDPNTVSEDLMDEKSLEDKEEDAEEKPLLRVRSFAKPPITWKDGQEKIDECNKNENTAKISTIKDTVDLTEDITQENSVRQRATIQVIPIVKGNCKTFVIPTGKSIINVKNITNTYVSFNPKNTESNNAIKLGSSQIISPLRVIDKNTKFIAINNISSNLSVNQGTNTNNQIQNSETKQKSTNSMLQCNQMVVLPMKQKENTSQSPKTNSSSSESK
ncbi:Death domain-associated protein 6 [Melipona quadrifasciata]|uniref:Death domain-associated protein 6 n=1 Tax=Melipona quadrifasciata TaxID=166423 RepID=A0A0M9A1M0_9HYME|nr:Death domain-associated protein 6 [Melipona quadrifasciata]